MAIRRSRNTIEGATVIRVTAEHDVIRACHEVSRFVDAMAFTPIQCRYVVTSVSELAHNLLNHADDVRTIGFWPIRRAAAHGIQIAAEDAGPGIESIPRAMTDGFSTGGGLGGGLPAVRRMMDEFEITSSPAEGTRVAARMWKP